MWSAPVAAQAGRIVTFGIKPTRAETAYGWLELSDGPEAAVPLRRFVEKPDLVRANAMLAAGAFLWNAGIFLFTARTIIDGIRQVCAKHAGAVFDGIGGGQG